MFKDWNWFDGFVFFLLTGTLLFSAFYAMYLTKVRPNDIDES